MKPFHNPRHRAQAGSALFIILIAVTLFAALSYVVAQMMRGGSAEAITEEKANLMADEILNYARAQRQNAQNLKISNGCADLDVSLENAALAGYGHTPAASDSCKLFHSAGGGMAYLKPQEEWLDMIYAPAPALRGQWFFPGKTCVPGTGSAPAGNGCNGDGLDNEAIIAVLPYVRKQVCVSINVKLGMADPEDDPPQETGNAWTAAADKYAGTQTDGERLDQGGLMAGCFEGAAASIPPASTYHFFQILVPR